MNRDVNDRPNKLRNWQDVFARSPVPLEPTRNLCEHINRVVLDLSLEGGSAK